MYIKKFIFPLAVTTAFLVSCSDNTASVEDDGILSAEGGNAAAVSENSSTSGTSAAMGNSYDPTSSQEVIEQVVTEAVVYQEAEGDLKLIFSESGLSVENDGNSCVSISGTVATISCAGNYYLSGKSSNFQVVVAASAEALVYLYLNGLDLTSGTDAPFYVQSAEKVFFMLVDGTENKLADASSRTIIWKYSKNGVAKEDTTMGTIYAKDDITFKGNGKLTVTGNYNNGIHTTNDLRIKDVPTITVTAKNNALKGKGSVNIEGGIYTLTASEGDGIKSDEGEDEGSVTDNTKGKIVITGGEFDIKSKDDGIQAYNYVLLADSVATPIITINSSGKGIVSDNLIYINAGIVNVTSTDDGIHSNMNVYFNGGETTISAGDDGVHADSTLMINNGVVNVTKAVEGFEGWYIIAKGGKTAVTTSDDGWNAAGGSADPNAASGSQWGGRGGGGMASNSVGYIEIYGGYHYLYAAGNDVDVLDANGTVKMSGGVVILELGSGGGMGGGQGGGPGGNRPGSQGGSSSMGSCSTNMSGGIIDTDDGITVSGGILLGFGSQTENVVNCNAVSFSAGTAYGSSNAAFKPSVSGSMIVFSNDVGSSVSSVDVNDMSTVELANGMTFYYK